MPYEIQVKAVERRFNRNKFLLTGVRHLLTIGVIVVPAFLRSIPSIAISTIGYIGYLSQQLFDYIDNQQLRNRVRLYKAELKHLINWYNHQHPNPNDQVMFANNMSSNADGYLLYDPLNPEDSPSGKSEPNMLGAKRFDFSTLTPWVTVLHFLLASVSYGAVITKHMIEREDGASQEPYSISLDLTFLIAGALAVIIIPVEQHLKRANLIRERDTYQDSAYAFYRPVNKDKPTAIIQNTFRKNWRQRLGQIKKGLKELFGFAESSEEKMGGSDSIASAAEQASLTHTRPDHPKVNANCYRFHKSGHQEAPQQIVEIIRFDPIGDSKVDIEHPFSITRNDIPLVYRP